MLQSTAHKIEITTASGEDFSNQFIITFMEVIRKLYGEIIFDQIKSSFPKDFDVYTNPDGHHAWQLHQWFFDHLKVALPDYNLEKLSKAFIKSNDSVVFKLLRMTRNSCLPVARGEGS